MRYKTPAALAMVLALSACQPASNVRPDQEPSASPPQQVSQLAQDYTQLGIGYMRQGQLDTAWQRLHRALEVAPNYSVAHNAMGLLYDRLKEPDKADEEFRKAVELNPTDSSAQTNYGTFLCRHGKPAEGEKHFLLALQNSLYQSPEITYADAGECLHKNGQDDKAEKYFRQALQVNPKIPNALLGMAQINYSKKHYLQARAYFERYLDVGERTPAILWLGIRIERQLGNKDAVASYAMLLQSKFPDSAQTKLYLDSQAQ